MIIDIYSDTVCPWCRVGKKRLMNALKQSGRTDVQIRHRAFQLDGTIPAEGVNFRETLARKFGSLERFDQMNQHLIQTGQSLGIPFDFDAIEMYPETKLSHQLIALAPEDRQGDVFDRVMAAYFEKGQDIGKLDVLVSIAEDAGMDGTEVRSALQANEALGSVTRDLEQARRLQITGVPFFVFDNKVAVSGAQPEEQFIKAMQAADER